MNTLRSSRTSEKGRFPFLKKSNQAKVAKEIDGTTFNLKNRGYKKGI